MSDIGDINSPVNVGSRSTKVDPKLFSKPSDFSGDRREWRHFAWVFRNWFGFLYDAVEEWLDQAASAPDELVEAVPDRRFRTNALYMSLAMVCKNEARDVVKTVTHKRGFESWRKLCKEYGSTTGTSLHELHESSGERLWNHGWIQEETVVSGKIRLLTSRRRQVRCSVTD